MKIKEFSIFRYGPLPSTGKVLLDRFNLIWGKNEYGKTLTIDALVKLLLRGVSKHFEQIDRVEENPEGYVILEDQDGKEYKLPEDGDLSKVVGLSLSECRNVFIVRNSDLSIANENKFYEDITGHLVGIRTKEIQKIIKKLQEIGKITEGGSFRNIGDEKLKERLKKSEELIDDIQNLQKKIEKQGFDRLEEEIAKLQEEIDRIEHEKAVLDDARIRERYEKGKKYLDHLIKSLQRLESLKDYNEDEEEIWREREQKIKDLQEKLKGLVEESVRIENEIKEYRDELTKLQNEYDQFNKIKEALDNVIKPELNNYRKDVKEFRGMAATSRFHIKSGAISAFLLAIVIIGLILKPLPILYGLFAVFLVSTGIFWWLVYSYFRKKADLERMLEGIRAECAKLGFDTQSVEEIEKGIRKFEEKYQITLKNLQKRESDIDNLEKRLKELREQEIPHCKNEIRKAEKEIEEIKAKTGLDTLKEYRAKLKEKKDTEQEISNAKTFLKEIFTEKSWSLSENISFWREEISLLSEYKDKAKGVEYDENKLKRLEKELQEKRKELESKTYQFESIRREIQDVGQRARDILRMSIEQLPCETIVDLKKVNESLEKFVEEKKANRENVLEVIDIFEKIKKEEMEKVADLFGKDSKVSLYFRGITGSLYEKVDYDKEGEMIFVTRKDGKRLEAGKLSGGAYDQLYFSIRIALGEKLLGDKGFFILDDPFIKADPDRIKAQIEMLKRIANSGWQILYFSAKGEIKDILQQDIEKGNVNYIELQPLFS